MHALIKARTYTKNTTIALLFRAGCIAVASAMRNYFGLFLLVAALFTYQGCGDGGEVDDDSGVDPITDAKTGAPTPAPTKAATPAPTTAATPAPTTS